MKITNKYLQSPGHPKLKYPYIKNSSVTGSGSDIKLPPPFTPAFVLKNTEFLTHLESYVNIKRPISEVDYDNLHDGIDPAAICKIIIQDIYLLQIAYLFKLKIFLSVNFYTDKGKYVPSTPNLSLFQLFCFENQIAQKSDISKMKSAVLENRFIKLFDQQKNRINDFFLLLELLSKHISEYLRCTEKSSRQRQSNPQVLQNRQILAEFLMTYENVILLQKCSISQPKYLIKFLEQTRLFRTHSILVKITNNTLFYSMKSFSRDVMEQLKFSVSEIRKFFIGSKGQSQYQKQVFKIMDIFFTRLCTSNVIEVTKSLKSKGEEKMETYKDHLSLFDYDIYSEKPDDTIVAEILVPEQRYLSVGTELLNQILNGGSLTNFETNKEIAPHALLEMEIRYFYETNEIEINCITDIDVLVDNVDYLNYLITSFNEGINSTVVVDTIEKFRRSITKKIEKVIAFRLNHACKHNQEPLTKMLELIDMAVIAYKVFKSELGKRTFIKTEDYDKTQKICQSFKHYENIFQGLIRKFYADLKTQN